MPVPKTPLLTVDCVVLDADNRVLFIRRKNQPYSGQLALPGGFVDVGETVESAARRELLEETGVRVRRLHLIGVYSDPKRDPRGHTCSVAYWSRVAAPRAKAGSDATVVVWLTKPKRTSLAFDHHKIVTDALRLAAET